MLSKFGGFFKKKKGQVGAAELSEKNPDAGSGGLDEQSALANQIKSAANLDSAPYVAIDPVQAPDPPDFGDASYDSQETDPFGEDFLDTGELGGKQVKLQESFGLHDESGEFDFSEEDDDNPDESFKLTAASVDLEALDSHSPTQQESEEILTAGTESRGELEDAVAKIHDETVVMKLPFETEDSDGDLDVGQEPMQRQVELDRQLHEWSREKDALILKIQKLESQVDELKQAEEEAAFEKDELMAQVGKLEIQLAELATAKESAEATAETISELEAAIDALKQENGLLSEQLDRAGEDRDAAKAFELRSQTQERQLEEAVRDKDTLTAQLATMEIQLAELATAKESAEATAETISELEAAIDALKQENGLLSEQLDRAGEDRDAAKAFELRSQTQERQLEEAVRDKDTLTAQLATMEIQLAELATAKESAEATAETISELEAAIDTLQQENGRLSEQLDRAGEDREAAKAFELRSQTQERQLEEAVRDKDTLTAQLATMEIQLAELATAKESAEATAETISELEAAIDTLQQENGRLSEQVDRAGEDQEATRALRLQLTELEQQLADASSEKDALLVKNQQLEAQVSDLDRAKAEAISNHDQLSAENQALASRIDELSQWQTEATAEQESLIIQTRELEGQIAELTQAKTELETSAAQPDPALLAKLEKLEQDCEDLQSKLEQAESQLKSAQPTALRVPELERQLEQALRSNDELAAKAKALEMKMEASETSQAAFDALTVEEQSTSISSSDTVDESTKRKFTKLYRAYKKERKLRKQVDANLQQAEEQRNQIATELRQLRQQVSEISARGGSPRSNDGFESDDTEFERQSDLVRARRQAENSDKDSLFEKLASESEALEHEDQLDALSLDQGRAVPGKLEPSSENPVPAASLEPSSKAAASEGDNLTRINGIGKVTEDKLKKYGVTTIEQIARWDQNDIAQISQRLNLKSRVSRDDWVGQAKLLLEQES